MTKIVRVMAWEVAGDGTRSVLELYEYPEGFNGPSKRRIKSWLRRFHPKALITAERRVSDHPWFTRARRSNA